MSTIAFYPGSFNPWHAGHSDVLQKALMAFDLVVIAQGHNPDKEETPSSLMLPKWFLTLKERQERVHFVRYQGLMVDAIKAWDMGHKDKVTAVVRGLRNGQDLESERVQQYWNEDLGLTVPTMFILSSR
jgi:pantetheine-phosphate adenylyltransferase